MTMTIAAISAAVLPKINGTAPIVSTSEATTVLVGISSPVRVGGSPGCRSSPRSVLRVAASRTFLCS